MRDGDFRNFRDVTRSALQGLWREKGRTLKLALYNQLQGVEHEVGIEGVNSQRWKPNLSGVPSPSIKCPETVRVADCRVIAGIGAALADEAPGEVLTRAAAQGGGLLRGLK